MAAPQQPAWIFRARPYDLAKGVERNVWYATTALATDEPFEGWLSFDGSNDWVAVPSSLSLDVSNVFYVEAVRFRTTTANQEAVLMVTGDMTVAGGLSTGTMLYLDTPGGVESVAAAHSGGLSRTEVTFATDYSDGEWHTLLALKTTEGFSNVLRLYYDGDLVDSVTPDATPLLPLGKTLRLGANSADGDDFDGDIERAVLLNTANLSGAQTLLASRDLTASVVDGTPISGLVAAYPINEGYGSRVQDVSGQGNHGTLVAGGVNLKWSRIAPPPGTIPGLLQDPFRVSASLVRGGSTLSASATPSFGGVRLLNPDGQLDGLVSYSWSGRLVEQLLGNDGDPVTSYEPIWVGQAEEPSDAGRDELRMGIRGIEDVFQQDLQPLRYQPGFEPYFVGDAVGRYIDFGDVLDRGLTQSFAIGVAFRTTTLQASGLYGKKAGLGTASGYMLSLGGVGAVRLDLGDNVAQFDISVTPSVPYNDGNRHTLVALIRRDANTAELFYDGAQVGSTLDITALGNLDNAFSLTAGAFSGAVPSNFLDGEIERVVQDGFSIGTGNVDAFLDARLTSQVDTSWAGTQDHAVPLTENAGTLVGDLGDGGHDGTIMGVPGSGTGVGYLVNAASGLADGTTVIPVDTGAGTILVDDVVRFGGDSSHTYLVTVALAGGTFTIASPGLIEPIDNNATVALLPPQADGAWSGTPHGSIDIEGEPLPILLGRVSLRRAVLVDPIKLIWQVSDSNMWDIFSVREGFVGIPEDTTTTGEIWTNTPMPGTWRWRVESVDGRLMGYFRLGSQPTGTVTFSADETNIDGNPSNAYPANLARSVANRIASSLLGGLAELENDAPYVSGHYWTDPISGSRAMDEVLAGAGAHWTVDPREAYDLNGQLRINVFQAKDVSAVTPAATYLLDPEDRPSDFEFEGPKVTGIAPVYRSVTLRYKRYGEALSLSEPQGTVSFDLINEMTHEWRSVSRPSETSSPTREEILDAFLGAEDYDIDTGIWTRSAAVTEAERLIVLHNRHNRIYKGELNANLFAHWIGDVVDITGKRLIGDNVSTVTRRFLVAGVTDDAKNSGTVLDLWGGFVPQQGGK